MSVFNDFQRLWMQRFPQSSLSDAWEEDVRASLERHKLKIVELTKELEQESLYVAYLERLLSDVEKFRESGGDPSTLFEAANINAIIPNTQTDEDNTEEDAEENLKSSLNLRESTLAKENKDAIGDKDKSNRLSLNTDNKYTTQYAGVSLQQQQQQQQQQRQQQYQQHQQQQQQQLASSSNDEQHFDPEGVKDVGSEKDSHNNVALDQCIAELASIQSSGSSGGGVGVGVGGGKSTISSSSSNSNGRSSSSSHNNTENYKKSKSDENTRTSQFVTVIEVNESKTDKELDATSTELYHSSIRDSNGDVTVGSTFTSFGSKIDAPPLSPALTSPMMSASSYAAHLDAKKKMPPRPPPKAIRRVEPPTVPGLSSSPKRDGPFTGSQMPLPSSSGSFSSSDSPGNSLERNVKPSDILRQKSTECHEANKHFIPNRKTTPDFSKFANTPELLDEYNHKIGKSESLEKTKRSEVNITQSPTGSLGRTVTTPLRTGGIVTNNTTGGLTVGISPTSSLNKTGKIIGGNENSSTGSLDKTLRGTSTTAAAAAAAATAGNESDNKNIGSKESIASQGISEIIKSYESVSSLSSDSAKVVQNIDNEPYYDSVPLDNGDGEYVFIKPGGQGTGSSSSRDDLYTQSSTMPMGSSTAHLSSQASVTDPESPGRTSTYANIDYFLRQSNETRSSSLDSDGEYDAPPLMRTISHDEHTSQTPGSFRKNLISAILVTSNNRGAKIRAILNSIIRSETSYVECLHKMIQYRKYLHASQSTSQPVIKEEDENTIFFKIDELFEVHTAFLSDLKASVAHEGGDVLIGETFKRIADMFNIYSAFLHNYGNAVDIVKKRSATNDKFRDIVSSIVVDKQNVQSLEDLLHKPVARVQINALVFNDLLNETPINHPDHQPLRQARTTIQMFLDQFNVVKQGPTIELNRNLRRMVKNSFIVELVDNHRKLRHLFLFNDVIACAKHGRDRIAHELKWYIPLKDVIIDETESNANDLKESSPANILQLKSMACTVRDQLLAEERDEKTRNKGNGVRMADKIRRKLADLESQLVLASPNLVFRLTNKATNKMYIFFLSSDFERTQWIQSINSLKQNCNIPSTVAINPLELHAFIIAMQKAMKLEMGSYLMRNCKDQSLLVGDLHMTIQSLTGLEQSGDFFVCLEVDSYGHYFRKATTKTICRSKTPTWNESFFIELEGSQNIRILVYESLDKPKLRYIYVLKLSRSWLQETSTSKLIKLSDTVTLNTCLRYVPGEVSLRRVPTAKPGVLFGAKMNQVLKREKRDIPFIISACIREVERRGMCEVGIYRVSGSASDLLKLKKSFETNAYEAEQLLKDVDIHSVTGILKSYLRELPEALFTDMLYPKLFETYNMHSNITEAARIQDLLVVFEELPAANKASINHILDHLIRVHENEGDNKMSLHNLAMVFGPTLLRPGQTQSKQKDQLASGTVDVMAQAGILYCFLQARLKKD